MFSDSLLDSHRTRTRRGWSTLLSFAIETIGVALLVLIPLLSSVALPTFKSIVDVIPFGSPTAPPRVAVSHPVRGMPVVMQQTAVLHIPSAIPPSIKLEASEDASVPPSVGIGVRDDNREIASPLGIQNFAVSQPLPPRPAPEPPRIHISQMQPGALIHQVQPAYPEPARFAHVQGTVQLAAIIARDGTITNLRVLNGPPLLVTAAVEAVRQWRYRPYILNGQAVEVETQISVNFTLGQQ